MMPDWTVAVSYLNADLRGEHAAIVQYLTHAWGLGDPWGAVWESTAREEMRHFRWLAHAVVGLGGIPDLTPPPPVEVGDPLVLDIAAEEAAIRQYRAHQAALTDPALRALLDRIVADEEAHLRRFQALAAQADRPVRSQPAPQAPPADRERLREVFLQEYAAVCGALAHAFLRHHLAAVGVDWEDRAVESMQHLSWAGEALASVGEALPWGRAEAASPESAWDALAKAAGDPDLAARAQRAARHWQARAALEQAAERQWTVGPLRSDPAPTSE